MNVLLVSNIYILILLLRQVEEGDCKFLRMYISGRKKKTKETKKSKVKQGLIIFKVYVFKNIYSILHRDVGNCQ